MRKRLILVTTAAASIVSCLITSTKVSFAANPADSPAAKSAQPATDAGSVVTLYNQKKYAEAAEAFEAVATKSAPNATLYYYGALANMATGQNTRASQLLDYIVKVFPNTLEAANAKRMLLALPQPSHSSRASEPEHHGPKSYRLMVGGNSVKLDVAGKSQEEIKRQVMEILENQKVPARSREAAASQIMESMAQHNQPMRSSGVPDQTMIDRMLTKIPSKGKRPQVSENFVERMRSVLQAYPPNLLRLLYSKGCRICLAPSVIDFDMRLQNTRPSGYDEGQTFKDCPAMFNGRVVIVTEVRVADDGSANGELTGQEGSMRHELGHALDHYLGDVTSTPRFRDIYFSEHENINPSKVPQCQYYYRNDRGGPSETFAELCCYRFGGRTDRYRQTSCILLHKNMPRTYALVGEILAKADGDM